MIVGKLEMEGAIMRWYCNLREYVSVFADDFYALNATPAVSFLLFCRGMHQPLFIEVEKNNIYRWFILFTPKILIQTFTSISQFYT